MQYPRIKEFNFNVDQTHVVRSYEVGRLDRIAYNIYGYTVMYKPLAAVNNITLSHGYRTGTRRLEDALRNELKLKGLSGSELETEFNRLLDEKRLNDFDWYYYSDVSYGMMSEVYEGRVLYIPTFESADSWLKKYEYVEI